MKQILFAILLLVMCGCVAETAFAENSIPAGFSPSSLWLSKASVTAGDTVHILTTVYNSTSKKVAGDVIFLVDDVDVGTAHFELPAGVAEVVSVEWRAKTGNHVFRARIENGTDANLKQTVSLSSTETGGITFTVVAAPPPPVAIQAFNSATKAITDAASSSAPVISSVLGAVFNETENLRKGAVASLENALENEETPSQEAEQKNLVLGAETYRAPNNANTLTASISTAPTSSGFMRVLQTILLFLVSYQWVFYPLLILLLLAILYVIGKGLSRKKHT
ncbi:MAG: hypothetical protein KBC74_01045 [Candidatus Pacebacteria bacterium]|nr:hypothetical protein [Candidatus Paceibacterota bacterium]MBP9832100.1 hypothetical protein [Candidatus Paceibacterota bacterium]